jgi:hypothetical protein
MSGGWFTPDVAAHPAAKPQGALLALDSKHLGFPGDVT